MDLSPQETIGLIRPEVDIHTLGISTVGKLLQECGYQVISADAKIAQLVANIDDKNNFKKFEDWLKRNKVTRLGFSYRLDPKDAFRSFSRVYELLQRNMLLREDGGPIAGIYFAGLPAACEKVIVAYKNAVAVFKGDETPLETLQRMGVPLKQIPGAIIQGSKYDESRLQFGKAIIDTAAYKQVKPREQLQYSNFGTFEDSLPERVACNSKQTPHIPLMRAHIGPYSEDSKAAKKEFNKWLHELADAGFLDIVSVGSSQLSQSAFGTDWKGRPNGGGVPVNSEQDLKDIWKASRPMLVRIYSGTKNIPELARIYDRTLNIAWYALSFWWFNQIDGRGPYSVKKNLEQHLETLKVIAELKRPFEPNVPHHFAFRGADDYTYVLSAYLAAKTAKKLGIKYFVLQIMLNTPKATWGIQDLAKARAALSLVRELEDDDFKVYLQPRAGLDYFSPDFEKAKAQLAAVTALMDDIEPENQKSPDIIHVVSYCEGIELATPKYVNESIQIVIETLKEYRALKASGAMDGMIHSSEVDVRTHDLHTQVKEIVALIEKHIENPYTPEGLYQIFKIGIFATPYLWEGREEFKAATQWKTSLIDGSIKVVDENGQPIEPVKRVKAIFDNLKESSKGE